MIYYFYSEKEGLSGLINHRLVKKALCESEKEAIDYAQRNCGLDSQNPEGYIYKCTQMKGEFFNNRYKTDHPMQIIGCISIKDIYKG